MRFKGRSNDIWRVCPFYAAVESLSILPEDNDIYVRFNDIVVYPSYIVKRISFEGATGSDTEVKIEMLAEANDWAVVYISFVLQLRVEFF